MNLVSPNTGKKLLRSETGEFYSTEDGSEKYPLNENVVRFLEQQDAFYEGSYLNRVKFVPSSENIFSTWPLWLISNGYLWEVRKQFKPGSTLLELGCASGVDYFGKRYNMIGLDLSLQSLKGLSGYKLAIQADAAKLPLPDASVDGIISSYFWEHIPPDTKSLMLKEFWRVLKPGGKLVFLYDVQTENRLVDKLKKFDRELYKKLFLDGDGHFGYETPEKNRQEFIETGFKVVKHFGMERTWIQSNSVYEKIRSLKGVVGLVGRIGYSATKLKVVNYVYIFFVRIIDETIGRLYSISKSRIILSVLVKRK